MKNIWILLRDCCSIESKNFAIHWTSYLFYIIIIRLYFHIIMSIIMVSWQRL